MATLPQVRARVRRELADAGAVHVWTDDQLGDAIADALRELSYELRRPTATHSTTTVSGQREYAIGAPEGGIVEVIAVEHPTGQMLPREELAPADTTNDRGYAQAWSQGDAVGEIRLRNAPGSNGQALRIYYAPLIAVPPDDSTALAVAADEVSIVALMACRFLMDARATDDAKRGLRQQGNPFRFRVEAALNRRRRRVKGGVMRSEQ
jgi:hypothetical protein